ncbi:MAG: thioredoxin family protein [Planctomycetes bacterium]|nr:thioredoxin family protein [Planctomycetota bacterium]
MKLALLPLLSLLILFCSSTASLAQSGQRSSRGQDRLFNHARVEQAWEAAIAAKKPLLVMFTSDNCVYCRKMLAETYGNPAVRKMLAGRTESVLAHANEYGELAKRMGIRGFPTTLVVSHQGEVLDLMEGFVEPRAFVQRVGPLLAKEESQGSIEAYGAAVSKQPAGR